MEQVKWHDNLSISNRGRRTMAKPSKQKITAQVNPPVPYTVYPNATTAQRYVRDYDLQ